MGITGAQGFATLPAPLLECLHPGDAPVPAVDFEAADIRPCHGLAPCLWRLFVASALRICPPSVRLTTWRADGCSQGSRVHRCGLHAVGEHSSKVPDMQAAAMGA